MATNLAENPSPLKGLDAKYFTDPAIYDLVKKNIYFKTWQLACHSSQVNNVGDCFTFSIFDQEILVVRGHDRVLRAMYNVCQHRGHILVQGPSNRRSIVCPYHAWTYDLDGRLKRAPNSDKVRGFDPSSICVPQIRLEEFLGFVFVNLDDDCDPMDETYPGSGTGCWPCARTSRTESLPTSTRLTKVVTGSLR